MKSLEPTYQWLLANVLILEKSEDELKEKNNERKSFKAYSWN